MRAFKSPAFLMIFLLTGLPLFAAEKAVEKVTIAILSFTNNTGQLHLNNLGATITENLKTQLSGYPELAVVEREHLENILKEQALSQTGLVKEADAVKIGQLSNARYIIYGEYNGSAGKLTILAHVVDVNTSQLVGEKVTGSGGQHLQKMVEILAYNIRHNLTGQGGRVDKYKIKDGWYGSLAVVATVSAVTAGVMYAIYNGNYDNYHKTDRYDDFDVYYDRANAAHKVSVFFIYTAGAFTGATLFFWLKSFVPSNYIQALAPLPAPDRLALSLRDRRCFLTYQHYFKE